MSIRNRLDNELSAQLASASGDDGDLLRKSISAAQGYASIESALVVLSDLKERKSHIFAGDFAKTLLLAKPTCTGEIESIWEQEILDTIHPDDLEAKMLNELLFLHHIQKGSPSLRFRQSMWQQLRMKKHNGEYAPVLHRLYYIPDTNGTSVRFGLCLYSAVISPMQYQAVVVNNVDGSLFRLEKSSATDILTRQEIAVLEMVANGRSSKEIAQRLSISVHTVSRHRQNINAKLQVHNSFEACRIARILDILN